MTVPSPGRHRVRGAAAAAFACLALAAGCGGDDVEVKPAADRSDRIDRLKDEVKTLKQRAEKRRVAKRRADRAAARASAGAALDAALVDRVLAGLPGSTGVALAPLGGSGQAVAGGDLDAIPAWSTIKVPISQLVLADAGGPDGLSAAQSGQIQRAITLSDNEAAASLFAGLEAGHGGLEGASKAVGEELAAAGSPTTVSTQGRDGFSTYGQTVWPPADQARYMASLAAGCAADPASTGFLLDQMGQVTADTWGLGQAGLPARWKGGWGPGVDGRYLVRQMGVLEIGGQEMAVALAAIADDGGFESAQLIATQIARRIAGEVEQAPSGGAC